MSRIKFHQNLAGLKERLLTMAGMSEQAIQRAVDAYSRRSNDLAEQVLRTEQQINSAERDIDQLAIDLLAMEQPMAVDLRFILAVIKINADLERVGDQATNIVALSREMQSYPAVELPVDIPHMANVVGAMVRKALQSFIDEDADAAEQVLTMDDDADRLNADAFAALTNVVRTEPEKTPQALNAILVCRNLERVGDHATNVAEDVIFWIRGADVRHPMSRTERSAAG